MADSDAFLTRPPLAGIPKDPLPFDLHVLGLPPAFTLSQDQTLHLSFSTPPEGFVNALSAEIVPGTKLLACIAAFELTCCSVTNVC